MKINQTGRSMVEMLGVLAIIGVLSAGGLAGYNKAMTQHKLNKHMDEINYLLATAIYNNDKLKDASTYMIPEMQALKAFTWNVIFDEDDIHFYDSLQTQVWFEHNSATGATAFSVRLPESEFSVKVCHNYINIFKNFTDDIDLVSVLKAFERDDNGHTRQRNVYIGKGCTSGKCLATMTNTDIINLCHDSCSGSYACMLYAHFGYPAEAIANLLAGDGVAY
ncbi:MAG: hypothetical protein IJ830_00205 [Alphaproteobacteria bacterium]|nr:hypothetical protein [Alphaproteobacteria bacterium]